MGKQSNAKRKAKLKERRKKAEAALTSRIHGKVAEWFAAGESAPLIIAELFDESGTRLVHIQGDDDNWTILVADEPVAGMSDEFAALAVFLKAAVEDQEAGGASHMVFSTWLVEQIEARCEASDLTVLDYLSSLLPAEMRNAKLPSVRVT